MKERIVSLDIAKGICIVLVALGHAYVEHPITVVSIVQMFYLPVAGYLVSIGVRATLSFSFAEALIVTATGVLIPMLLHNYVLKRYAITRFLFGL